MKAHIGLGSRTKIIHSAALTAANVAIVTFCPISCMGRRPVFGGDQAYRGQRKVIIEHAPRARDFSNRRYWRNGVVDEAERRKYRTKSKVRAKAEHAFFEARLRLRQGPIPRARQERALIVCDLRSLIRSWRAASAAGARGVVRSARVKSGRCPESTPKGAYTRRTRAIDCRRSQQ
jgi:hypothetical protein